MEYYKNEIAEVLADKVAEAVDVILCELVVPYVIEDLKAEA